MKNTLQKMLGVVLALLMLLVPMTAGAEATENYIISDATLAVGTAAYPADTAYDYTVYIFTPSELGKYTIAVTDGLVGLVSYHDMWVTFTPDETVVSAASIEWECTGVGQSIMVAVAVNGDAANITVTHENTQKVEVPWTDYVNVTTPEAFTFTGDQDDMMYVDTFDSAVDEAVLGKDGYYHLNTATGPILYADLDESMMSLVAAQSYGQLTAVIFDEDGEIVQKIRYYDAFDAYIACADSATMLYPLTVDLIEIYQKVGESKGWYGADGFVGGDEADAWMFACYYNEGEEFPDTTTTTKASETVVTTTTAAADDAQVTTTTAADDTATTTTTEGAAAVTTTTNVADNTVSPSTGDASNAFAFAVVAVMAAACVITAIACEKIKAR